MPGTKGRVFRSGLRDVNQHICSVLIVSEVPEEDKKETTPTNSLQLAIHLSPSLLSLSDLGLKSRDLGLESCLLLSLVWAWSSRWDYTFGERGRGEKKGERTVFLASSGST